MIIRKICRRTDFERLKNFDASFTTDLIYDVKISGMSVEITEEKLYVPFQKTYFFDSIKNDIDEADFAAVAEIEEEIAGFATVKFEAWNKRAVLSGIFVSPESKGKGVGRALLKAITDFAKTTDSRCLFVETQNVNYPAIQFYRKMGFEFCGFDTSLYNPADVSPGETAFYFYKHLPE